MKLLAAAGAAGLLVLASCRAPGLTQDQIRDPSLVAQDCQVDPIGFDRRLVVSSPVVSFPSGDVFPAVARLVGSLDDGATTFAMLLERGGASWKWIRQRPDLTLPGDTTIRALQLSTDVGYGGSVTERFAWPLTRDQIEAFADQGFVGDVAGVARVSFPSALFAGFIARWDEEVGAMAGS